MMGEKESLFMSPHVVKGGEFRQTSKPGTGKAGSLSTSLKTEGGGDRPHLGKGSFLPSLKSSPLDNGINYEKFVGEVPGEGFRREDGVSIAQGEKGSLKTNAPAPLRQKKNKLSRAKRFEKEKRRDPTSRLRRVSIVKSRVRIFRGKEGGETPCLGGGKRLRETIRSGRENNNNLFVRKIIKPVAYAALPRKGKRGEKAVLQYCGRKTGANSIGGGESKGNFDVSERRGCTFSSFLFWRKRGAVEDESGGREGEGGRASFENHRYPE